MRGRWWEGAHREYEASSEDSDSFASPPNEDRDTAGATLTKTSPACQPETSLVPPIPRTFLRPTASDVDPTKRPLIRPQIGAPDCSVTS